jgi:UDP-N-acetylglucosamine 1-carboxyvinyltransferase
MGADIRGAGTSVIKINGVPSLTGGTYSIIPDQIEAGTYMAAAAAAGGEVLIKNVIPKHLDCITAKLAEMGVYIENRGDMVLVRRDGQLRRATVKTMPYPGFPTDMQPQMGVLMSVARGVSQITEDVWDNRFKYLDELKRMGARVKVEGKTASINGVEYLTGAAVKACDLRAGAAMVIAGLCAKGTTVVEDVYHIERGYENIVEKLRGVGADIVEVSETEPQPGKAAAV